MFVGVSCGDEFWGLDVFGAAERLGFDGLFAGERMIVHRPSWDVVTMCTAIACATERITVGAAAAVAPFRHPTVLAKELTGLDRISGGRLVVGVAAGGDDPVEFEAAGAAVETRQRWTTETVEILKRYFSGARFDYDGKLFSLRGVRMNPPPARPGGPPVWIAGRGTRSQRRAARVGDGFLPYLVTPKQCARLFGEVRELAGGSARGTPSARTCTSPSAKTGRRRGDGRTSTSPGATPTRASPASSRAATRSPATRTAAPSASPTTPTRGARTPCSS